MSSVYQTLTDVITANQLMDTIGLVNDFIKSRRKEIKITSEQTWREFERAAEEQGRADFFKDIETKHGNNTKHMLSEIFRLSDTVNNHTAAFWVSPLLCC